MSDSGFTRRELVRRGGLLALLPIAAKGTLAEAAQHAASGAVGALRVGPQLHDAVVIRSDMPESRADRLDCTFTGTVDGDHMGGELELGEYLTAQWSARRHAGGRKG